ncbi:MAG: hypothetical protein WA152_00900 [Microgenomates group bacterium]
MLSGILPVGGRITLRNISNMIAIVTLCALFTMSTFMFFNINKMIRSSQEGYEDKVGKDYKYLKLLSKHTPSDSLIIHPPQGDLWPAIGNQPVARYFLFPRGLVSGAIILDDSMTIEIRVAYFVEIIGDKDRPTWPIIDNGKNEIIFNNLNSVKFKKLDIIYKSEEGIIYRILF